MVQPYKVILQSISLFGVWILDMVQPYKVIPQSISLFGVWILDMVQPYKVILKVFHCLECRF